MGARRIHLRPPGVKTGSTIGPLGPFRGTLGIQWVIGSIVVGLLILFAVSWALFQGAPDPPFVRVAAVESLPAGSGREVLDGVFLGRAESGAVYAVAEPINCPLQVSAQGYLDCLDLAYRWDGRPHGRGEALDRLPLQVYRGDVFVDPRSSG